METIVALGSLGGMLGLLVLGNMLPVREDSKECEVTKLWQVGKDGRFEETIEMIGKTL